MILLDTNIILCSKQPAHPNHQVVTEKLLELASDGTELVICPQTLYELYVVATRPAANNGLGLPSADAVQLMTDLQTEHSFMNDPDTLFTSWKQIMHNYGTLGKAAHDARLVAFMQAHGIENLYTQNVGDFNRYANIITLVS